mmetsp:Transcript_1460/g.967  ORF Transcript_1460/g.967 Transcript_1460/m.967 type:complete len:247 (-) Transcript_1460:606-1346(-)
MQEERKFEAMVSNVDEEQAPSEAFTFGRQEEESSGKNLNPFKVDFQELNQDFRLPPTFQKLRKLGTGAYGKVFEVLHKPTGKKYAVKRFEEVFTRELRGKRLLRELNILASVKHCCLNKLAFVVPPEDYSSFNEVYIILDPCEMDMKKLLKSSKQLEEVQVKSIVYDILCGLLYLHKAQIVHRDLKPANILVNDNCTIQICDFGLARSLKGLEEYKYHETFHGDTEEEEEQDNNTPSTNMGSLKDE